MPNDLATRLTTATKPIPDSFFSDLLSANHILYHKRIVDGYGHVSARSPQNPATFYLSASRAPALVSGRSDLVEYRVEDGECVDSNAPKGYLERFIHSEIYKRYPEVQSVVHAHAEETVAFSVAGVPLKPVYHMAGSMGASVPVFDVSSQYSSSARHDMLISSPTLGAALASSFAPSSLLGKTGSVLKSFLPTSGDQSAAATPYPPHSVVLMRGHGFTAVGHSLREAVYRANLTVSNARIQLAAVTLQGAWNSAAVAERVTRVGKEGYESGGPKLGEVKFLSEREAKDSWEANSATIDRPWELWVEEVRRDGFYQNDYWDAEDDVEEAGQTEQRDGGKEE